MATTIITIIMDIITTDTYIIEKPEGIDLSGLFLFGCFFQPLEGFVDIQCGAAVIHYEEGHAHAAVFTDRDELWVSFAVVEKLPHKHHRGAYLAVLAVETLLSQLVDCVDSIGAGVTAIHYSYHVINLSRPRHRAFAFPLS